MGNILIKNLTDEEKRKLDIFKAKKQYKSWKEMILDLVKKAEKD